MTLLLVSAVGLFIVSTVPDHFLDEHWWRHVARRHVPRIFLWTLGALAVMHLLTEEFDVRATLARSPWLLLLIACVIGIIPESGPHLIFITLFAERLIPFSVRMFSVAPPLVPLVKEQVRHVRALVCPTMKLTTLEHVIKALETLQPKVRVHDRIRLKARTALDAMLGKA